MAGFSKILMFVGLLLLFHAGYSAVQHRSFLKLAEEEYTGLPNDIALECLIAALVCSLGVASSVGRFKDIRLSTELNARSYETVSNRPSFITFNHRGRALYNALR